MRRPPRPLPLLLLGAACAIALVLVYGVAVRTADGQRIDEAALRGRVGSPVARAAAEHLLTTISVGSLALAIAALVGLALLRRRAALALAGAGVVVASVLTTEALKLELLTRPTLAGGAPDANTFPSGHTTIAFAVGIAATLVAPARWRWAVATAAFLFGTATGVATVAAGWHRPSDVVGALLVVVGWTAALVLATTLVDRGAFGDDRRAAEPAPWPQPLVAASYVLLALGLLAVGWATAIAIVAARHVGAIALTRPNAAFVAACATIAALAALLTAALMATVREALPAAARPARPSQM